MTPMRHDLGRGGRLGRAGITPRAHSDPSPAFPVSRFLERKGSWQRSSLTCRAAERATRAALQFYALRKEIMLSGHDTVSRLLVIRVIKEEGKTSV